MNGDTKPILDLEPIRLLLKRQAGARVTGYVTAKRERELMRKWLSDQGLSDQTVDWVMQ